MGIERESRKTAIPRLVALREKVRLIKKNDLILWKKSDKQ
jgi:hypothetical protein